MDGLVSLFANVRTVYKLAAGFGVLLVAMIVVGGVGVQNARRSTADLDALYHREMGSIVDVRRAQAETVRMGRCTRQAFVEPDDKTIATEKSHVEKSDALVLSIIDGVAERLTDPEERAAVVELREAHTVYAKAMRDALAKAKDPAAMRASLLDSKPQAAHADEVAKTVDELLADHAQATFDASLRASNHAVIVQVVVVAIATLLGLLAAAVLSRAIAGPLGRAVTVLRGVAQGDFTQSLDMNASDEVGQMAAAVDEAAASMRSALGEVRAIAGEVASAAGQFAEASQSISRGTQEQATNLETTAASLEEITATVKGSADHAQRAASLAVESQDVAERGGQVVQSAVSAMGEIMKSSKKISDIVVTIEEFAFQTNLLALNAAVEAARAGEHGRGFAVVASEVRNLAQNSANAARTIKTLIGESVAKVTVGSEHVGRSGETLSDIVASARQMSATIQEIAAAAQEQTKGMSELNSAVTRVDRVTQSTAAQTEELATTAESLASQADQLRQLVAKFRLGDEAEPTDERTSLPVVRKAPVRRAPVRSAARTRALPPPMAANGRNRF